MNDDHLSETGQLVEKASDRIVLLFHVPYSLSGGGEYTSIVIEVTTLPLPRVEPPVTDRSAGKPRLRPTPASDQLPLIKHSQTFRPRIHS